MATPPELKASHRKQVATQTAAMLARMAPALTPRKPRAGAGAMAPKATPAPTLAEDFPLVQITLEDVIAPPDDLASLLEPRGLWLHLVRSGDRARYFSISDEEQQVLCVTRGDLPQKIYNAAVWLDGKDGQDNHDPACVISIPPLYVHALGISRKKGPMIVPLAGPESIVGKDPKKFTEISLAKFLDQLADLRDEIHGSLPKLAASAKASSKVAYYG